MRITNIEENDIMKETLPLIIDVDFTELSRSIAQMEYEYIFELIKSIDHMICDWGFTEEMDKYFSSQMATFRDNPV